jgi:Ca-activated chloride channel family protein
MGALKDSMATVEGGELGSGYSMMGIFEIERTEMPDTVIIEKFAQIKLHYKLPGDTTSRSFSYKSLVNYEEYSEIPKSYRFAAAVATFGSLLRFSSFTKAVSWNNALLMAQEAADKNDKLQAEFVALVEQAKALYSKGKKKKKSE